jgi:hypothetical protein
VTDQEKKFLNDLILGLMWAVHRHEQSAGGLSADGSVIDAARGRAFEEIYSRADCYALVVEPAGEPELILDKDSERQKEILSWLKVAVFFGLFLASKGHSLPESYALGEEEVVH